VGAASEQTQARAETVREALTWLHDDTLGGDVARRESAAQAAIEALDALLADLAAAERERDEARAGRDWQYEMGVAWRNRAIAAEVRVERLQEALGLYGGHKASCEIYKEPWLGRDLVGAPCDCGFAAAVEGEQLIWRVLRASPTARLGGLP
jgi:hypothetical protein